MVRSVTIFLVKGELEWKVGKWAGVPVRPGIAHWERRERIEAKEREVEEKEKGGTQGEGKGEGDEEIEEGLGAVAISEGGEPQIQEGLKPESPPPQVNLAAKVNIISDSKCTRVLRKQNWKKLQWQRRRSG